MKQKSKWQLATQVQSNRLLGFVWPSKAADIALYWFSSPIRFVRPLREEEYIRTAEVLVSREGLHGYRWGRSERKVLLVHGWNGRGSQLGSFATPLVDAGFEVLAFDGPAHGESPGERTNPKLFAEAIQNVNQEFGPVESVIAHSFGVGCAVLTLHRGLKLKHVVLVAGPANYQRVVEFYLKRVRLPRRASKIFQQKLNDWVGIPSQQINIVQMGIPKNTKSLVVHDIDDKDVRFENAKIYQEAWSHSEFLITSGLGHRRILKDLQVIEKVKEFLLQE